jgi:hypothetical protein
VASDGMTDGMTDVPLSGSVRSMSGARPSRRLGAAAPLGTTRPSASSFIGRNSAAPKAADQGETRHQAPEVSWWGGQRNTG